MRFYKIGRKICQTPDKFDRIEALLSPSDLRVQGMGKIDTLAKQLLDVNGLDKLSLVSTQPGSIFLKQRQKVFREAYCHLAIDIDEKNSSLPLQIRLRPDVTLAYYYGSKVTLNLREPLFVTRDIVDISFNFHDQFKTPFYLPIPQSKSEVIFHLGILFDLQQRVDITIKEGRVDPKMLQKGSLKLLKGPVECTLGTLCFDLYTPPAIEKLPVFNSKDPETNLSLVKREQFYNNYKKYLLQVGDGTSLEKTIRLHYQMYAPEKEPPRGALSKFNNLQDMAKELKIDLFLDQCDSEGIVCQSPKFLYGNQRDKSIEVVWDITTPKPLYFLAIDPEDPNMPILDPQAPKTVLGFIRYEQFYNKYKKLLLQVDDGTSLEKTVRLHYQICTPEQEPSPDIWPKSNDAQAIAQAFSISLRLYECDSYGKEMSKKDIGQPRHPVIEIVQDVTSVPNVYFLAIDPTITIPPDDPKSPQRPPAPDGRFTPQAKKSGKFVDSPPSSPQKK